MVMEVNLRALQKAKDIRKVVQKMNMDEDNPIVAAIISQVQDLEKRKTLQEYLLEEVGADTLFLNLLAGR